jgi:hypothetical protein
MAYYEVSYKVGNTYSMRGFNMDYPSESLAKELLLRQNSVPRNRADEIIITNIKLR